MTEPTKRGGVREGAGPKPKSPGGERMKLHTMRWTAAGWADAKLIGHERVRELVAREAARVRLATVRAVSSGAFLKRDKLHEHEY